MQKIYLHGWNYRGQPFELAVRRAKEFGFDGIEAFPGHFSDPGNPLESQRELKRVAEAGGVNIPVASLQMDMTTDDESARRETLAACPEYIAAIAEFGFELINGWIGPLSAPSGSYHDSGSAMATEAHYDRAIEGAGVIARAAETAGIDVVFELHMNMIHDTVRSATRIIDAVGSPRLKANYDPANMHGYDHAEPPEQAVRAVAPYLAYSHLKNCRRFNGETDYHYPLRSGDLDYSAIIRDMYRHGFRGPYCLEYSGAGDRNAQTREDYQYLRGLLDEIESED